MGFKSTHGDSIGLAVHRLNHSATLSEHSQIIVWTIRTKKILKHCCFASNRRIFFDQNIETY